MKIPKCPHCDEDLEITFVGEKYYHLLCRSCETQVMMPTKLIEGRKEK